jgi:hypothetical protein
LPLIRADADASVDMPQPVSADINSFSLFAQAWHVDPSEASAGFGKLMRNKKLGR